jgi:hypothetical protein
MAAPDSGTMPETLGGRSTSRDAPEGDDADVPVAAFVPMLAGVGLFVAGAIFGWALNEHRRPGWFVSDEIPETDGDEGLPESKSA